MLNLFNKYSFNLEFPESQKLCLRTKLDTGLRCNANCQSFCYYKNNLRDPELDFEIIKSRIDLLSQYTLDFDLSGGEPSYHSRFFDIIDYCISKGAKSVSCLTNGFKFADFEFLKKAKEHGLNEILFSLHSIGATHDALLGVKGAFEKITKAIKNAKDLNIKIRINSIVNSTNYHLIDDLYFDYIESIQPFEVNFLPVNYFDSGESNAIYDYNIILDPVKRFIDKSSIKLINVRYVPYCFMKGYERYVCGYFQHFYDIYDWNGAMYDYQEPTLENMIERAKTSRLCYYNKPKKCTSCKYFNICDGIEKQLKIDVNPEPGDKIKNPIFFRMDYYNE